MAEEVKIEEAEKEVEASVGIVSVQSLDADPRVYFHHIDLYVDEASDIRWGDNDKTWIFCTLKLSDGTTFPYHAHSKDSELYGRELFARLEAGEFGKVGKVKVIKSEEKQAPSPAEKLKEFLDKNPDVKQFIGA